jgi:hypothetical protein
MPRGRANLLSPGIGESPADLLSRAARMRQHARYFAGDPIENQLEQYADELESKARQMGTSLIDSWFPRPDKLRPGSNRGAPTGCTEISTAIVHE